MAQADEWYIGQSYLKGSNFLPATAINQLEMWQAETFDIDRMKLELSWAAALNMTTMRVFLHDLVWQQDSVGFVQRIELFLAACELHRIKPMIVLFDSVWDPYPKGGLQKQPTPGIHNSGWVQSPGREALADPSHHPRLQAYVKGIISAFAEDKRVLAWDLWNEPDNTNGYYGGDQQAFGSYVTQEPPDKEILVAALLPRVFDWARSAGPLQPLTCGVWKGDWSGVSTMSEIERMQLDLSDVISFHNYGPPAEFEKRVGHLRRYNRPILCTEYMARVLGNDFEMILPLAVHLNVGAINWGFVSGKSQTHLPWDSWDRPYVEGREAAVWFHDIFHEDGTPYRPAEIPLLRDATRPAKP